MWRRLSQHDAGDVVHTFEDAPRLSQLRIPSPQNAPESTEVRLQCGDADLLGLLSCYRADLEFTGRDQLPDEGPVLVCANHANSLLDPVLVGMTARRPVRFVAKAPLFKSPVLGPLMGALGMIPAFRGQDDRRQVKNNQQSLDKGVNALVQGDAVGIFPEGKSHDYLRVEMVRGGAARMALEAVRQGADQLQLVPLGLNYRWKERFRSSV